MSISVKQICRKIAAVGRNYRDHAKELNNPIPSKPIIFLKPSTSIIEEGEPICIPKSVQELHHEVELGVVIGETVKNIQENKAMDAVLGYVLALDMTDRSLQNELKSQGLPWTLSKGFDTSCPIGKFIPRQQVVDPHTLQLWLEVNGEMRQRGNTGDMLFSIAKLIAFVSETMTLERGDILLTGTPAGVGPVKRGDTMRAGIDELSTITFKVE